jgi:hypothetical protein
LPHSPSRLLINPTTSRYNKRPYRFTVETSSSA